ncbi:hypothetical protein SAMN05444354_11289 [Stigmatella aurantiaca]|uniref:Uncharacterized protein n=1 Tax=Stigmatella aurantiaca TaxID=41 RepID=A0A1H7VZY7_STIAU|nr:hypothetical protein [Stigmatella aurantiaca]SEM14793.1 hypothetical protein SAMN05444354_11289 [Stigmatella aurantiaca]
MRRWSLALLLSLASPALAQAPDPAPEAAAPAPTPAPAATPPPPPAPAAPAPRPSAPPPAPPPAAPAVAASDAEIRSQVKTEARAIFENLLMGDVRSFAEELLYPFQLEDKRYGTAPELVTAWVKQLRQKRTDLVTLYGIEVLSLAEMEKKYGKPPARLGLGALKEPDLYAAVANLSGHPAVLLFRAPREGLPHAFAYTD